MWFESKTSETPSDKRQNISTKCAFLEFAKDVMKPSIEAGRTKVMPPSATMITPYIATMISKACRNVYSVVFF